MESESHDPLLQPAHGEEELAGLVAKNEARIRAYLSQRGPHVDIDEIYSAINETVLKKLRSGKGPDTSDEVGALKWIFRIAYYKRLEGYKAAMKHSASHDSSHLMHLAAPEDNSHDLISPALIQECLDRLSKIDRQIIDGIYVGNKTLAETGSVIGMDHNRVYRARSAALSKIRGCLESKLLETDQ